jgi:hypothetical protein
MLAQRVKNSPSHAAKHTSFIKISIEAGSQLRGNAATCAYARTNARTHAGPADANEGLSWRYPHALPLSALPPAALLLFRPSTLPPARPPTRKKRTHARPARAHASARLHASVRCALRVYLHAARVLTRGQGSIAHARPPHMPPPRHASTSGSRGGELETAPVVGGRAVGPSRLLGRPSLSPGPERASAARLDPNGIGSDSDLTRI